MPSIGEEETRKKKRKKKNISSSACCFVDFVGLTENWMSFKAYASQTHGIDAWVQRMAFVHTMYNGWHTCIFTMHNGWHTWTYIYVQRTTDPLGENGQKHVWHTFSITVTGYGRLEDGLTHLAAIVVAMSFNIFSMLT